MKNSLIRFLLLLLTFAIVLAGVWTWTSQQIARNEQASCIVLQSGSQTWNVTINGLTLQQREETWMLAYDDNLPVSSNNTGRCIIYQNQRYRLENVYTLKRHRDIAVKDP